MKQTSTPKPAPQPTQADLDNRSRQLNPTSDAYWQSRGQPGKPAEGAPAPPPPSPEKK
jgi:hypothetical protein